MTDIKKRELGKNAHNYPNQRICKRIYEHLDFSR